MSITNVFFIIYARVGVILNIDCLIANKVCDYILADLLS